MVAAPDYLDREMTQKASCVDSKLKIGYMPAKTTPHAPGGMTDFGRWGNPPHPTEPSTHIHCKCFVLRESPDDITWSHVEETAVGKVYAALDWLAPGRSERSSSQLGNSFLWTASGRFGNVRRAQIHSICVEGHGSRPTYRRWRSRDTYCQDPIVPERASRIVFQTYCIAVR